MDVATMRQVFPGLGAARAAELNSGLNAALRLAGCTTVNRAAMFCAQVGEESISLTAPTELASGAEIPARSASSPAVSGCPPSSARSIVARWAVIRSATADRSASASMSTP